MELFLLLFLFNSFDKANNLAYNSEIHCTLWEDRGCYNLGYCLNCRDTHTPTDVKYGFNYTPELKIMCSELEQMTVSIWKAP